MGLDDLDVEILADDAGDVLEDLEHDVDADAHVGCQHAARLCGQFPDRCHLVRRKPRRPDDDGFLVLRGDPEMLHGGLVMGEVDHDVALPDDRFETRRDRDTLFPQPQGLSHILTDGGMPGFLDGRRHLDAVRHVDDGSDPAAHLPAGPHDDCLYHVAPPFLAL